MGMDAKRFSRKTRLHARLLLIYSTGRGGIATLDVISAVDVRARVYIALNDGTGRFTDSGMAFTVGYNPQALRCGFLTARRGPRSRIPRGARLPP
jgi:hypothetical protein